MVSASSLLTWNFTLGFHGMEEAQYFVFCELDERHRACFNDSEDLFLRNREDAILLWISRDHNEEGSKAGAMAVQLSSLYGTPFTQQTKLSFFNTGSRATRSRVKAVSGNAQELLRSGVVQAIRPKDAATAIDSEGYRLLDIRPVWEREKARVKGSINVALYVKDEDNGPITLLKKWVHFGYIGLWTGQYLTTFNPDFLEQVEAAVPDKETKLLVACGEGLRSLIAVSKLYNGGFKNLGWLAGGFNRAGDSDFTAVEGTEKLQYATIGGVSYYFLQLLILLQAVGKND